MSNRALTWARALPADGQDFTAAHKSVLLVLADRANDAGETWPRIKTLATETWASERTVRRAIADLKDAGLLETHPMRRADGTKTSLLYRLKIPGLEDTQASTTPGAARRDGASLEHPVRRAPTWQEAAEAEAAEAAQARSDGMTDLLTTLNASLDAELRAGVQPTVAYQRALVQGITLAQENSWLGPNAARDVADAVLARVGREVRRFEDAQVQRLQSEALVLGRGGHRALVVALLTTASSHITGDPVSYVIAAARRIMASAAERAVS